MFPELDRNIPLETHHFMAARANAFETVEVAGASHSLPVSQPQIVAEVIIHAAEAAAAAE